MPFYKMIINHKFILSINDNYTDTVSKVEVLKTQNHDHRCDKRKCSDQEKRAEFLIKMNFD